MRLRSERVREMVFAGVLVLALVMGVLLDAVASDVSEPNGTVAPDETISARAVFCPPSSGQGDTRAQIALGSMSERPAMVAIEPLRPTRTEIAPSRGAVLIYDDPRAADVVGYGGAVGAGSVTTSREPVPGVGAAQCSATASTTWYFAAGSASLASQERILIYNPFPDEAVVGMTFYTPTGQETKTTFQEVPVPARSWRSVDINKAIRVRGVVGVALDARRGRVVAWRELFSKPEELPPGVQASLGATTAARRWFFPDGAIGPGAAERISVLNPNDSEARVNIRLATSRSTIQPRRLLEVPVPRQSAISLSLEEFVKPPKELTSVSATLTSLNEVDVVAERTVWYSTGDISGVASETGSQQTSERWLLPPAAIEPSTDAVAIMNPTSRRAQVDISFLRTEDAPVAPGELQNLVLGPGSRVKLPVGSYTEGRPMLARVVASEPVVAERFAYSNRESDVASVMGLPLRQLP
jgi:hypothetical protein